LCLGKYVKHFQIQLMPFFTFPYPGRYVPDGPRMKVLVG